MPTKREREYYQLGFQDGVKWLQATGADVRSADVPFIGGYAGRGIRETTKPKRSRPLNSWQKFVKANSKKRKFRFKDGKLKLKSMGIAYRKTAAYKRSKK